MTIITISRGSFAGGKAIAEQLGERLGQPVLGREEVVSAAARKYGINEAELTTVLNESPPFWRQVPGKRLAYVKCVTAELLEHARDGDLIYHGNVGHLLLTGVTHALNVRVIADAEYRIAAAMKKTSMPRDKAEAYVRKVDLDRQRWAMLLYGVDLKEPTQYTVILNLAQIGVDGACDTIVQMSELDAFKASAESRKHYDDLFLGCRVWAALAREPETRSASIEVNADDGNVHIVGSVRTGKASELIPRIAEKVEGVKSVRSEAGVGTDWFW